MLEPGIEGKELTVTSLTPSIVAVSSESAAVTTDSEGAAKVTITGLLPGTGKIEITEPVSGVSAIVTVKVTTADKLEGVPESVTAALQDGSAVTDGMTVASGTQIILSTETEDAAIRYTVNGVCPKKAGALIYSGPITITEDTQLQAVALKDGIFGQVTVLNINVSDGGDIGGGDPVMPSEYTVSIDTSENGTVTADKTSAPAGTVITLSIAPQEGYALSTIVAKDAAGNELTLSPMENGNYTFTMPESDVTVTATFERESLPFIDIEGHWAMDAILYVSDNEIMNGVGEERFSPEGNLGRGMMAQIIYNMEGRPAVLAGQTFTDVPADAWYAEAVNWAAQAGIVGGHGNGTFTPEADISREQLAKILYEYAKYKGYSVDAREDLGKFTDTDEVSTWAVDYVKWAVAEGLIEGKPGDRIDPTGTATRAEVATIMMRFCETISK